MTQSAYEAGYQWEQSLVVSPPQPFPDDWGWVKETCRFWNYDGLFCHQSLNARSFESESYVAETLCVLSCHGERFAWVVKKYSVFFNLALKAVKVSANFASDGSLFQSGIVIMKEEFENGFFLVWMGPKLCVLPLVLLSGLHMTSIERASCLFIALQIMQSPAVWWCSCKLSRPRLSISWVEVSPHSLL